MLLYLGKNRFKVYSNHINYSFNSGMPLDFSLNQIRLLSNDGFILKDKDGLYLIPKQEVDVNGEGI